MNMKTKKLITRFVTSIAFSILVGVVAAATTADKSLLSSAESITVKNINGVIVATFNPAINKARIFAAQKQGFPEGAKVNEIIETTNALVAMNSGFFNEGKYRGVSIYDQAKERFCFYTRLGKTYAFPSAILIVDDQLLSDTGEYLPALGINDAGEIKIGEAKVVWNAQLSAGGKKIPLNRISDLNPNHQDFVVYYNSDPSTIKEIAVSQNRVTEIKVAEKDEMAKKTNGYRVIEPSQEIIDEFLALSIGDYLSRSYELEAAAYPEQVAGGSREKDQDLSDFFNQSSHVVSGGQLLMYQGKEDLRISAVYPGRGDKAYENFGTVVCLHKNGMVSLIAIESGRMPREDVIRILKDLQCEYAVSLDGGRSTNLITMIGGDKIIYGKNRVVSDIIAIMPQA